MGRLSQMPSLIGSAPSRIQHPPKEADSFYTSPAWRALIASIKRERGNRCEDCGASGRVIGDHVHEIKDGGAMLDRSNVRLLCWPCHNRKTARAKKARVR